MELHVDVIKRGWLFHRFDLRCCQCGEIFQRNLTRRQAVWLAGLHRCQLMTVAHPTP